MMILIVGTPDSGKSAMAENITCRISEPADRYYIATMIPFGDEGSERIAKHRSLRSGKGFVTIEQPFDVAEALESIPEPETATLLLECVSNLAANEMFERKCFDEEKIVSKIVEDVRSLQAKVKALVVVSNRFPIEPDFDEETKRYSALMDVLNQELEQMADECITI